MKKRTSNLRPHKYSITYLHVYRVLSSQSSYAPDAKVFQGTEETETRGGKVFMHLAMASEDAAAGEQLQGDKVKEDETMGTAAGKLIPYMPLSSHLQYYTQFLHPKFQSCAQFRLRQHYPSYPVSSSFLLLTMTFKLDKRNIQLTCFLMQKSICFRCLVVQLSPVVSKQHRVDLGAEARPTLNPQNLSQVYHYSLYTTIPLPILQFLI